MSLPRLIGLPFAQQERAKAITASHPQFPDRGFRRSAFVNLAIIFESHIIMCYKAQAEKPVHEFGRKVLSLQNENFKCNMVMPAPGAGRAL